MRKLKNEINIIVEDEDGTERTLHLRYDLNALEAFEDKYENSILEVFAPSINEEGKMVTDAQGRPVNVKFRFGMLTDLLFVGLHARHPEFTRADVGAMFDPQTAEEAIPKIAEALANSNAANFPKEVADKPAVSRKK